MRCPKCDHENMKFLIYPGASEHVLACEKCSACYKLKQGSFKTTKIFQVQDLVEDTEFLRLHNKANDRLKSAGQANEVVDFSELVSCMGEDFDEFYGLH